MLKSVQFENFQVLRDTMLPLDRMTVLIGPNGSGKSTAIRGLQALAKRAEFTQAAVAYVGSDGVAREPTRLRARWETKDDTVDLEVTWEKGRRTDPHATPQRERPHIVKAAIDWLSRARFFEFDPRKIGKPEQLDRDGEIRADGSRLVVALDRLRDDDPDAFERINDEVPRWFPHLEKILFETVGQGTRALLVRTRDGGRVPAEQLSDGERLGLALLAISEMPQRPSLMCIEEPDRGIHPRLLECVVGALKRIAYPEEHDSSEPAVQLLLTTHSPYLLDYFHDRPQQVVIAERMGAEARFRSLGQHPHLTQVLAQAPLGEVWYRGTLGGVPLEQ